MDKGRIWTGVNHSLDESENGHCLTLVGWLAESGRSTMTALSQATTQDGRDVVVLANKRVLFIRVKPSGSLGMRAAFKAIRGDFSGVVSMTQTPRDRLESITFSFDAPRGLPVIGDLLWASVKVREQETRQLLVDDAFRYPNTVDRVRGYLAGDDF